MKIGEDAKFVLEYLQESSSLKICNLPLQAYIINEEGAMRKAGLEALGDEIKTYEARINTLRNLQVEISDELMQVLNLTYYNKIIGYLIQDSHKFGVVKNYENICRYIENKKIKERELLRLENSIKNGIEKYGKDKPIIVCMHYPPLLKDFKNSEFTKILEKYNTKYCIYGHLHGKSHVNVLEGNINGVNYKMASCDYTKFDLIKIV